MPPNAPQMRREKSKSKSKSRERKGESLYCLGTNICSTQICGAGECFLCERPTSSKCPNCEQVFYCCNDHLLVHKHQNYCFPFRVRWRTGAGRCLVATRDIKAMELILIDAAIAHGPPNMTTPGGPRHQLTLKLKLLFANPATQKY